MSSQNELKTKVQGGSGAVVTVYRSNDSIYQDTTKGEGGSISILKPEATEYREVQKGLLIRK